MIKTLAQQADSAKDIWALGFDALWDLFDLATEKGGETAIYEFLAGPFEMTAKQVADLELETLIENIKQMAAENNLAGFFKSATALMR